MNEERTNTSSQSGCLSTLIFVVIGGTIFGLIQEFAVGEEKSLSNTVGGILLLAFFGFIAFIVRKGVQQNIRESAKTASEVLATDHRAPVIYLRPFTSDKDTHDDYSINEAITSINPYSLFGKALRINPSFEQQLAFLLNDVGPFIGLSAPNVDELSLGAAKLEFIAEDWHNVVNDYFDKCRLIVMRVGESAGLVWEIEQIKNKELLNKLVIYLQFPGPQDNELIEARFRKFGFFFTKLTGTALPQQIGKNRFLYFVNNQASLSKTLGGALNSIGFIAEKSNYRGIMKAAWPGADNSTRKPMPMFQTMPNILRCFLFALFSTAIVSFMFLFIASLLKEWTDCPGTIMLSLIFVTGLLGGIVTGRVSVILNVEGGPFHTLWGVVLIFFSLYSYLSILWDSWNLSDIFEIIERSDGDVFVAVFLMILALGCMPWVCYIYSWSEAEKKQCRL